MSASLLKHWLPLCVFVLFAYVQTANTLHCWQCNTIYDKFCKDVPAGPVKDIDKLETCLKEMYKECKSENGLNYTLCRKQVQTVNNEPRIIRSCGFSKSQHDCYMTKNPPVTTEVCQCEGDGCNGSQRVNLSFVALFSAIWLAFLALK